MRKKEGVRSSVVRYATRRRLNECQEMLVTAVQEDNKEMILTLRQEIAYLKRLLRGGGSGGV